MRLIIGVIIGSLGIALLNVGVSFVGYADLVWIVAIALFICGVEDGAVAVAVLAGFLFDMMIHGNVGTTSLTVLVGLGVYVIGKSLGVADRLWQRVLLVIVVLIVCFAMNTLIKGILDGVTFDTGMFEYWLKGVAINAALVALSVGVIQYFQRRIEVKGRVKLS